VSTPFTRNPQDPLSLIAFDEGLLDQVSEAAKSSPRKRSILRFHEHEEPVQRMLNAIEPESYVQPHLHPTKPETFVVLRGKLLVARYDENGTLLEGVLLAADGPVRGVEIPPGAWHSIMSLEEGTVAFEAIQGPYDPATHKLFAPWAPPEAHREAGLAFMSRLRAQMEAMLPEVAAIDQIEAEEDEIC
jgi:cupin fold WbuC family metalloprotein